MGAPAYEWPTRTTGPSIAFTRVAIDSASEDSPRSGFGIATTVWPALFSSRITPPNPDASANAPWTRTTVVSSDTTTPFRRGRTCIPAFAWTWRLLTRRGRTARHNPAMKDTGVGERG